MPGSGREGTASARGRAGEPDLRGRRTDLGESGGLILLFYFPPPRRSSRVVSVLLAYPFFFSPFPSRSDRAERANPKWRPATMLRAREAKRPELEAKRCGASNATVTGGWRARSGCVFIGRGGALRRCESDPGRRLAGIGRTRRQIGGWARGERVGHDVTWRPGAL